MLSTTGMSPRRGSTTVPRKAEIANKIAVPIVERSPVVHIGGNSCKIALMTGQLVPHATAIAARRAMASRRRNRSGFIRPRSKNAICKEQFRANFHRPFPTSPQGIHLLAGLHLAMHPRDHG